MRRRCNCWPNHRTAGRAPTSSSAMRAPRKPTSRNIRPTGRQLMQPGEYVVRLAFLISISEQVALDLAAGGFGDLGDRNNVADDDTDVLVDRFAHGFYRIEEFGQLVAI